MAAIEVDLSALPEAINRAYYPLLEDRSRLLVLMGGAGAGKSVFAAQKLLVRAISETTRHGRPHRFLVLRKVARTVRRSCWRLVLDMIDAWGWGGLVAHIAQQEMVIRLLNGAELIFSGLDDREKIKSIQGVTGTWLEEATEFEAEDLDQLLLRVRGEVPGYKQHVLTFNPISQTHWLKTHIWDRPGPHMRRSRTTHRDNRWLAAEDHADIERLAETNPTLYRVYGLGEWGVLVGLIYEPATVIGDGDWPEPWRFERCWYGVDFGFNHHSAVVWHGLIDGVVYEREVLYQRGLTHDDLARELAEAGCDKRLVLWCDEARPEAIEVLRRAGWRAEPCPKGRDSVMAGINLVRSMPLRIHASAANVLKEHASYAWRLDRHGQPMEEPVKAADHAMDARRYGVWGELGGGLGSAAEATAWGGARQFSGKGDW